MRKKTGGHTPTHLKINHCRRAAAPTDPFNTTASHIEELKNIIKSLKAKKRTDVSNCAADQVDYLQFLERKRRRRILSSCSQTRQRKMWIRI